MRTFDVCKKCGCPFANISEFTTADVPRAWKDEDGTWYCGPAKKVRTETCANCGNTQTHEYHRGKLLTPDAKPTQ